MKRAVLLLTLIVPLLLQAQRPSRPAATGSFRLVSIHATGSTHFSEADIVAATGLKPGQSITPEQLKSIADALAATGAFEQVNYKFAPAGSGMTVRFTVSDVPEFLQVTFDNFVWFTSEQLMDAIRARVPLFRGEVPAQGEMTTQITDALQSLLAERGISGLVRFQLQEERPGIPISGGIFSVEGANIRIQSVMFPGADASDIPALESASRRLMQTSYQRSASESYAELSLRPVYFERGYLKVKFGEPAVTLVSENANEPAVSLAFPVTPGPQYKLGALRWSGNKAVQSADLQKLIKLKIGEPANLLELHRNLEQVHELYASQGYLRQTTEEKPTLDDSVRVASFELSVSEGDQYKFASLELAGLEPRIRHRVREEWKLREGEPYNPSYIKTFLSAALLLMRKGAVTRVQQDINDQNKTVEVTVHFEFQEPIIEPVPASPGEKPAGHKPSR